MYPILCLFSSKRQKKCQQEATQGCFWLIIPSSFFRLQSLQYYLPDGLYKYIYIYTYRMYGNQYWWVNSEKIVNMTCTGEYLEEVNFFLESRSSLKVLVLIKERLNCVSFIISANCIHYDSKSTTWIIYKSKKWKVVMDLNPWK